MAQLIMTVDDSAVIRAAVSSALQSAGFETIEACNGQEGLKELERLSSEQKRPAVILVDVNMPVMDGITFIKHVKDTDNKFVPILVLTTECGSKMVSAGREAGASGWLTKPFKAEHLVSVVRKFVR